jgi:spermidine/putrescine transport system ATP-binding protein
MDGFLKFESVRKSFGTARALDDVSLSIGQGEIFSLLGPSGCGKTTLLRIAAGFEAPDGGRVLLDGVDITKWPPNKRPVNTVFQNYALFPHLTVFENIAFGLRIAGRSQPDILREVTSMLEMIQLSEHATKKPAQLSGGQKQRVAIARALVNKPRVLLLDEPLAALDLKLRQRMLLELSVIHREVGTTFIYVTHDQTEAMSLSNRIAVMNHGRVEQIGSPMDLYEAPATAFVASFIGDTNMLHGTVASTEGGLCRLRIAEDFNICMDGDIVLARGSALRASIRPERIRISVREPTPQSDLNCLSGVLEEVIYLGASLRCRVTVGTVRMCAEISFNREAGELRSLQRGAPVWVSVSSADVKLIS